MSRTSDYLALDEPQAGLQRLAARFYGHAYDPHRHECYAIGITDWGVQSFRYRGSERASLRGQIIVIHPDEPHDGHAGVPSGFAYRMLYIDPALVQRALGGGAGAPPFVPEVVAKDTETASILAEAFADFPAPLEPLAADSIVTRLADALARRSAPNAVARQARAPGHASRRRGLFSRLSATDRSPRPISRALAASTASLSLGNSARCSGPRRTAIWWAGVSTMRGR